MTTVVYSGGVIASDSLATAGDKRFGYVEKIFCAELLSKRMAFGCAGYCQDIALFRKWVENGMKEDEKPHIRDNFTAIKLERHLPEKRFHLQHCDNQLDFYDCQSLFHYRDEDSFAIGSGANVALGALAMGATAKEAVSAACMIDTGSGGLVKKAFWDEEKSAFVTE